IHADNARVVINGDADLGGATSNFLDGNTLVFRGNVLAGRIHGDGLHLTLFDAGAQAHSALLSGDDGSIGFLGNLGLLPNTDLTTVNATVASLVDINAQGTLDVTGDLEITPNAEIIGAGTLALEGVAHDF